MESDAQLVSMLDTDPEQGMALIKMCIRDRVISTGMARSVYSNEAGWGSSPMVHASSKTRHPIEQGLWGSFEVFVDTFIVCTITALTVLILSLIHIYRAPSRRSGVSCRSCPA